VKKRKLSGSTDGKAVKVAATASAGTTIHTAYTTVTTAGAHDEIWLWAVNSDTVDRLLTIQFGGTTSPDDSIQYTVPAQDGLHLVLPGFVLQNTAIVRAFAAAANVILIHGFVNQITP
jgi:hypothetical protein